MKAKRGIGVGDEKRNEEKIWKNEEMTIGKLFFEQ